MNHHRQEKKDRLGWRGREIIKRQEEKVKSLQKKSNLISNIKNKIFCRLGASEISGVGVFAIRNIPVDTIVFEECNDSNEFPIEISKLELEGVNSAVRELIGDLLVGSPYDTYSFPVRGLNSAGVPFYLNHSDEPNVKFSSERGEVGKFLVFVSCRDIEEGEELTQDYNNLSQDKTKLYKQFPFLHDKK